MSTGFGVIVTDDITGVDVSSVPVTVTSVYFPAASVDLTTMVFDPLASVNAFEKLAGHNRHRTLVYSVKFNRHRNRA